MAFGIVRKNIIILDERKESRKRMQSMQMTWKIGWMRLEIRAIIVDPAAASFIAELRKRGFKIIKAKNDVEDGIRLVATKLNLQKIVFSTTCINTIKEFASYIWDKKAAENGEDKPVKQYDHAMDAVRYFVYTILGERPRLNRKVKGGI